MQRAQTSQRNYTQGCCFFRPGGARSSTQVMVQFIDDHRDSYRVEQICRVLPIAPSTYYREKYLANNPEKRSQRQQYDDFYIIEIRRIWQDSKCRYATRKVWQQIKADGMKFARCTIDRLMK